MRNWACAKGAGYTHATDFMQQAESLYLHLFCPIAH